MRQLLKPIIRRGLQCHLPVGELTKPVFAMLYRVHVGVREGWLFTSRLVWNEPLFRSQCETVGTHFQMEQLPYIVGRGRISIGNRVRFSGKSSFTLSANHGVATLAIGDGCFLGHNCAITVANSVRIGNYCLIAGGVRITDFDGHPIDADDRRAGLPTPSEGIDPVSIGDDVWIGHSAVILKGVRIGDRAVIGARSVVTHNVPEDCLVAGNPARVVKSIPSRVHQSVPVTPSA